MNRATSTRSGELSAEPIELVVEEVNAGERLDSFLARCFPSYSRAQVRRMIEAGGVNVDGKRRKVAYHVRAGERLSVALPELPSDGVQPEDIPLDVLFEDEHLAVINKPPGMVVHPGKGNWKGTLTAALAHHFGALSTVGGPARPGIVHRLDRDTSGVIAIAKTDRAHMALAAQFEARTVEKEYFAIVAGAPDRDRDVVEQPIGAHPYQREKMAIRADHATSREAATFYQVEQRFDGFAALKVLPKTGRTHQIRVHLAHAGFPVLCDRLYGGRAEITRGEIRHSDDAAVVLGRQALHARRLTVQHPASGAPIEFVAPLAEDMATTVSELAEHRAR